MRAAREFAFDFAPQDDAWLRTRLESFGATCRGTVRSFTLYLDTPEGSIAKLGFALGLRQRGRMIPPKASRKAQVASRTRWLRFIEDLSPAPHPRDHLDAALQKIEVREALTLAVSSKADEIFFILQMGSAVLEIRLDRATVAAAGKEFVVATATFRHLSGSVGDFLRGMSEVADPAKLRLSAEGTMIRARRRFQPKWRSHVGAFAPRLGRAMDMHAAFQAITGACFDQFLLNEAFVRELRDAEAVHQCRVALRRLRTALKLFRLHAGDEAAGIWWHDLKEFSALLREARDLDVLLAEQVEPRLGTLPAGASAALLGELEQRRSAAYEQLVQALEEVRAKRFYLSLAIWIEAGDSAAPATWDKSFLAFMDKRLSKATERLLERGDRIEEDSEIERHKTRIAAKNLRYGSEFLESLLSRKPARKRFEAMTRALKDIQQILGEHNDGIVAQEFFLGLAKEPRAHDPQERAAVVEAVQALTNAASKTPDSEFIHKARRAFRDLAHAKPFWTRIPGG